MSARNGAGKPNSAGRGAALAGEQKVDGARTDGGHRADRGSRTAPSVFTATRRRRRPARLVAGVAVVALGALGAAYVTQVVSGAVPVVAVARDVPAGEVLERDDLSVARVSADPAVRPVPAGQLQSLVGQRAAVSLVAGSLLTAGAVTDQVLPTSGRSLVGVALTSSQLPAVPLQPGDRVRIVDTPTAQGEPPSTAPAATAGEVVSTVGPDETGLTIVNVDVSERDAAGLAARAATGRVALVLDSRER